MQILQSTLNQLQVIRVSLNKWSTFIIPVLQIEMDKLRLLVHGVRAVPKE